MTSALASVESATEIQPSRETHRHENLPRAISSEFRRTVIQGRADDGNVVTHDERQEIVRKYPLTETLSGLCQ